MMTPENRAFVIHDVAKDQSVATWNTLADVGFYCGAPLVVRGICVGTLGCCDTNVIPGFGRVQEVQLEQLASLISQQYETWSLNQEMKRLEEARSRLVHCDPPSLKKIQSTASITSLQHIVCPEDYATLVFTDVPAVEWHHGRATTADIMNGALQLHDDIMRRKITEYGGYEVSCDGAAFHIAFSDVTNSIKFALAAQEALHVAPWDEDLLKLPEASEDKIGGFRGLRVSMSIHCGDLDATLDQRTGRTEYSGETFHITKNLATMGHGGQILLSCDVWSVASPLVESALGSPQVVDQGAHIVHTNSSDQSHDGVTIKNVYQLVPKSFAHDYRQSRRLSTARVAGRLFPPLISKKAITRSFNDAPCVENRVSVVVINTTGVQSSSAETGLLLTALEKRISSTLPDYEGYHCNDFTFAFGSVVAAVRFALALQEILEKEAFLDVSLQGKIKVGVQEGMYETMCPHPVTGRAEYFGAVVTGARLVADSAPTGSVYLGKEVDAMDGIFMQPVSNGFMLDYMGRVAMNKEATTLSGEISLFKCHACDSWYDKVLANRKASRGY